MALLGISLILTKPVRAASSYYVSPTGNDSGACSISVPCKTISVGVGKLAAGDTLIVMEGSYSQRTTITKSNITVQAQGVSKTLGFIVNANYVTIQGFDVNNPNSGDPTGVGIIVNGSYDVVDNNYVHNTAWYGIYTTGTAQHATITNNKVFQAEITGMFIGGANHLIQGNEIWDTLQYGPLLGSTSGADADGFRYFGWACLQA